MLHPDRPAAGRCEQLVREFAFCSWGRRIQGSVHHAKRGTCPAPHGRWVWHPFACGCKTNSSSREWDAVPH